MLPILKSDAIGNLYICFEHIFGSSKEAYNEKCDIWSLGVVFLEMLGWRLRDLIRLIPVKNLMFAFPTFFVYLRVSSNVRRWSVNLSEEQGHMRWLHRGGPLVFGETTEQQAICDPAYASAQVILRDIRDVTEEELLCRVAWTSVLALKTCDIFRCKTVTVLSRTFWSTCSLLHRVLGPS